MHFWVMLLLSYLSNTMAINKTKIQGKTLFKKIIRFLFRFFLIWMIIALVQVIILKWMPVPFTPTMLFRSTSAYLQGEDTKIYYSWTNYSQISKQIKIAVVASEDQRFPHHFGIDIRAVGHVIEEYQKRGRIRGGSTITQQVAKNVFLWQGGGFFRKVLEIPYTILIELIWGKQRILEVYLNIAEMGPQTFGVKAAAIRYFKKYPKQLSSSESATLAAVLPSPLRRSAQNPSAYVKQRNQQIQYQMRLLGGFEYIKNLRRF